VSEPFGAPAARRSRLVAGVRDPRRAGTAVAALVVAVLAAWTSWQPQRSVDATDAALSSLEARRVPDARADVARARDIDPLALDPVYAAATIEESTGRMAAARRLYRQAVRSQPSNPEPWMRLAQFELTAGRPRAAVKALGPALYLDPRSPTVQQTYLDARRQGAQRARPAKPKTGGTGAPAGGP
jgi:Tfp pilus assembly protein PilF